ATTPPAPPCCPGFPSLRGADLQLAQRFGEREADFVDSVGGELAPRLFAHVEDVGDPAGFGGDLRQVDVEVQVGQRAGDGVEDAQAVLRVHVDDAEVGGDVVVDLDLGAHRGHHALGQR